MFEHYLTYDNLIDIQIYIDLRLYTGGNLSKSQG